MNRPLTSAALVIAILSATESNTHGKHPPRPTENATIPPGQSKSPSKWHVYKTTSFRVFATNEKQAEQIAAACECVRLSLTEKWLGRKADSPWQPCCDVVVHPSQQSFISAVGGGPGQTNGCSSIRIDKGRVLARRIDLRCDNCDPLTAALPHELTHVVLADRFPNQPVPRWADEGIALLADSATKQAGHERDLRTAVSNGTRIPLALLVRMNDYPAGQIAAFYAQSSSVVRLLVDRSTEATFVDFVEYAMKHGYDVALQKEYGLRSIDELERLWIHDVLRRPANDNIIRQVRKNTKLKYAVAVRDTLPNE
jgi:hypothetical protein